MTYLARSFDRQDDSAKTRSKEDNISSSLCSLGGSLHSNTTISLLQGRSVVHT